MENKEDIYFEKQYVCGTHNRRSCVTCMAQPKYTDKDGVPTTVFKRRVFKRDAAFKYVLDRDGFKCHWCGYIGTGNRGCMTVEHVIPLGKGGTNQGKNLKMAHETCNNLKGALDADDAVWLDIARRLKLGTHPRDEFLAAMAEVQHRVINNNDSV